MFFGESIKFSDAGITNSALGNIEDSLDADFIKWVGAGFQICNGVLYFFAVIELGSAHHFVRNLEPT